MDPATESLMRESLSACLSALDGRVQGLLVFLLSKLVSVWLVFCSSADNRGTSEKEWLLKGFHAERSIRR